MEQYNYKVRVSCLTFNHAPYVVDTLNGFCLQQTSFPYICTIFDDCSTDGEQEVIRQYLQDHFDLEDKSVVRNEETDDYLLTFARHKTNENCFFAVYYLKYNHYSIGKNDRKNEYCKEYTEHVPYIALCEGDDYWIDPLKLQKQVDVMEENPECTICYGRVMTIDRKGNHMDRIFPGFTCPEKFSQSDFMRWEFLEGSWVFQTSSFLYKNEIMGEYTNAKNTRFKKFPHGDLALQLYCLEYGCGCFIPEIVSCYRVDSGGYNSFVDAHVDIAIKEYEKKIEGLKDYDHATNYRFHRELQIAILGIEWSNDKRRKSKLGFFNKKYIKLYKEKGFVESTKMFMSYYIPNVLQLFVRIKKIGYGKN